MRKISCIYKITSQTNGKIYVGSASDFQTRRGNHFTLLSKGLHSNKHLQSHYNKYGKDDLVMEIIEELDIQHLDKDERKRILCERENHWIQTLDSYNSGFNMCPAAESHLGIKRSDKTKRIMSEASTSVVPICRYDLNGNMIDEFNSVTNAYRKTGISRSGISNALTNRAKSAGGYVWAYSDEDPTEKLRLANIDNTNSDEVRKKISDKLKGIKKKPFTEEHKSKIKDKSHKKRILQLDINGNVLAEYESIRDACRTTGIERHSIRNVASGKDGYNTAGGYIWQFI